MGAFNTKPPNWFWKANRALGLHHYQRAAKNSLPKSFAGWKIPKFKTFMQRTWKRTRFCGFWFIWRASGLCCVKKLHKTITIVLQINGEPSALRGSTGTGLKARPFWSKAMFFLSIQNNLAYHPGPVPPPGGDGSPLASSFCQLMANNELVP